MFLDFSFKNFRSFRDRTVLSLEPVPKQTGHGQSIQREKGGRKTFEALSSAVILGPNGAGRSGVVNAFDTFRAIILRGHLRNPVASLVSALPSATFDDSAQRVANRLELAPGFWNANPAAAEPVEWAIRFITNETLLDYRVRLDLGRFLDTHAPRKVLEEELHVNGALVMKRVGSRGEKELWVDMPLGTRRLMNECESDTEFQARITLAKRTLEPDELFLTGPFRVLFSSRIAALFTTWVRERLTVVFPGDIVGKDPAFQTIPTALETLERVNRFLEDAAPRLGLSSPLIFTQPAGFAVPVLCAKLPDARVVPAELYASRGTVRLVRLLVRILRVLEHGGLLVVDDLDAHIHSGALMHIVELLHDASLNTHHAQLIFTAQNPVFLDSKLFRRDEIAFVDREEDEDRDEEGSAEEALATMASSNEMSGSFLYSLADFGTFGVNGVRKDEDYLKKFFEGKYGAFRTIDLADVMKAHLH